MQELQQFFKDKLSQKKVENDSDNSEKFAEQFLNSTGFPEFHRVDGNHAYDELIRRSNKSKRIKGMLTPDFVAGNSLIEPNNPYDFYIDINELTEGVWGNFQNDSKFPLGNPMKDMYEELSKGDLSRFTSDKPYRLLAQGLGLHELQSLYANIKKKSNKYSSKRNDSSRFGLISVMSERNPDQSMYHFTQLIWSIYEDLFDQKNQPQEIQEKFFREKSKLTLPNSKEFSAKYTLNFEGNWTFWIILGRSMYEGKRLILINNIGVNKLHHSNPIARWIQEL